MDLGSKDIILEKGTKIGTLSMLKVKNLRNRNQEMKRKNQEHNS